MEVRGSWAVLDAANARGENARKRTLNQTSLGRCWFLESVLGVARGASRGAFLGLGEYRELSSGLYGLYRALWGLHHGFEGAS